MAILTENALDATNEFEKLKFLFENSRYYLSSYFSNLKTQIDILFAQKEIKIATEQSHNKNEIQTKISQNWTQMIGKVNAFEAECFKGCKTNSFSRDFTHEITNQLNQIETKLNNQKKTEEQDLILDKIYATRFRLEKQIFSHRSILFLERSQSDKNHLLAKLDLNSTIGKLIILANDYIDTNEFLSLMRQNKTERITSTQLKFSRIIELIETDLDSQINEIKLDIDLIDLDTKKLESLEPNLFSGLIECKNIYISNNNLGYLEENVFNGLTSLQIIWLGRNKLTQISSKTFNGLSNLKRINLWQNELKRLEANTFHELTNLELVDLHSNKIEFCDANLFSDLSSLKEINLSNNRLDSIDSFVLKGLTRLEMINLSENYLESIDQENLFSSLCSLTHIILRNNKLKRINGRLFKGLTQLIEINLANNQLEQLGSELIHGLSRLKSLELQENQLNELNENFFHDLVGIKFIDISNNKIRNLSRLNGLKELKELHASCNLIECIHKNQFRGLSNLRLVNLSSNKLNSIDVNIFNDLNELREINLKSNDHLNVDNTKKIFQHLPLII